MTHPPPHADRVLRRLATGFSLMLVLIWALEWLRAPHRFFGEADEFNWSRVFFRTAIVLAIWAWVHLTSRRLLQRLHHLEEFLLLCSWCRKLGHQGKWLTLEEYFGSRFETGTSHGICPECSQKEIEAIVAKRAFVKTPEYPDRPVAESGKAI